MNFDQQNNDSGYNNNQQDTGYGQQQGGFGQAGFGDQQDISNLDQTQDTGFSNQGDSGIGSTYKSGNNQGFDSSMGNQDQGSYNTQTSDTSGMAGGARGGWDSGSNTLGSSGDNFGSGNQSFGDNTNSGGFSSSNQDPSMTQSSDYDSSNIQGGQAQNAWDDPNAQTDTSGSYNDNYQQSGNPSTGDKITGGLKKLAGKLGNNPDKYQEGERQQSGNY